MSTLTIVLSSVAVGAVISSLITGLFAAWMKKQELRGQDLLLAVRLAELKHRQLSDMQEWSLKESGMTRNVDVWDPGASMLEYLRGIDAFRATGRWPKADESHRSAKK